MLPHIASYRLCFMFTSVFWNALVLWPSSVWQPPDSGLTGHQTAETMVLQTAKLICHLLPSMCLHSNSFWKILTSSRNGVVRQLMAVCCPIFHCNLLLILLFLGNMVLPNVAKFVVFDSLCFVFRLHSSNALCPILWEDSEVRRSATYWEALVFPKMLYPFNFILNNGCDMPIAVSTTWGTDQLSAVNTVVLLSNWFSLGSSRRS